MLIKKRGLFYCYRFMVRGKRYRGSTELKNYRDAVTAAERLRSEIIKGNLGILERGPAPVLSEFLDDVFMPFVERRHAAKPKTLEYYKYGSKQLHDAKIGKMRLSEISDADIAQYIAGRMNYTAAGINQGLRTLRRAISLAFDQRYIERKPVIRLCPNEHQRDRVISEEEEKLYLANCPQPWRTMAIISVELGLRPGEILRLRVEDLLFEENALRVVSGKSKAARRRLPMTDAVFNAVRGWIAFARIRGGWLFPSPVKPGFPYTQNRIFEWHHKALDDSKVNPFEPYCLRHTALTRLAKHCRNPYAVAAAAGHSSITMTYRYVHPESVEIQEAFEAKSGHKIGHAQRRSRMKAVGGKNENGI